MIARPTIDKEKMSMLRIIATLILTFLPPEAFAHVGVGDAHGLDHGYAHPFSGLDHLLECRHRLGLLVQRIAHVGPPHGRDGSECMRWASI